MKLSVRTGRLALLLAACTLLPAAVYAAPETIDVEYGPGLVEFFPNTEWKTANLTIAGPECGHLQFHFERGERIAFKPFDAQGERLPDGVYNWNLRLGIGLERRGLNEPAGEGQLCRGREDLPPMSALTSIGSISVLEGRFVDPFKQEDRLADPAGTEDGVQSNGNGSNQLVSHASPANGGGLLLANESGSRIIPRSSQVVLTNADGVIRNSLCVGFDCPNSPTFDDTTILLMENNTRIKFDDTSTASGFPNRDWEIEANSRSSGGLNYFGVNDCGNSSQGGCTTDLVFLIEANAPANSIRVDDGGDVGFGTGAPVVDLHVVEGDTPTLRLEQDGSSGFAPQTWDVAGNETSFFIRDATNGSTLPFRIQPGAKSNMLWIDADDRVGVNTTSPVSDLHVENSAGGAGAADVLLTLRNNGPPRFDQTDANAGVTFRQTVTQAGAERVYRVIDISDGSVELELNGDGDLTILGSLFSGGGTCGGGCDRVFLPDTELRTIEEHSALMWENRHLPAVGPTEENGVWNISEKTGGILHELEVAHIYIEQLDNRLKEKTDDVAELRQQNAELTERLGRLEQLLGVD